MENEFLKLNFNSLGAELCSIFLKAKNKEILWRADSKIWARHAPVLFPIVGKLRNDTYLLNDKTYKMSQHGFARDLEHEELAPGKYLLTSNETTKRNYPYDFNLRTEYSLIENKIKVSYEIENLGKEEMYFSIGAHPGFNLNGKKAKIEFEHQEKGFYLLEDGLVNFSDKFPLGKELQLSPESFKQDALIFRELKSKWIKLYEDELVLTIHFTDVPYLGIWSKVKEDSMPFVCIEPWWGIADTKTSNGKLKEKEGINVLSSRSKISFDYIIEINN